MLRLLTASLVLLLVGLAPAAWAAPADRTVAVAPLVDEAGLAPLERRGFEAAIRGAVLDALFAAASVQDASDCDDACRRDLMAASGARWLLTTNVVRGRQGFIALLALYGAPAGAPTRTETLRAADLRGLRASVEAAVPGLLRALPAGDAPPAVAPRPTTSDVLMARPVAPWAPDQKSVALALGIQFFVPTGGLFYAEAHGLAVAELGGYALGFLFLVQGLTDFDGGDVRATTGLTLIVAARLFGLVAAPLATSAYNRRARERWEQPRAHDPRTPRHDPLAGLAPDATLFALPAVSF